MENQLQVKSRNLTGFANIEIWKKLLMVKSPRMLFRSTPHPCPLLVWLMLMSKRVFCCSEIARNITELYSLLLIAIVTVLPMWQTDQRNLIASLSGPNFIILTAEMPHS